MLRKDAVGKPLWDLLKRLQASDTLSGCFLVGGTALSLQIGHRESVDIDLFTRNDLNKDEIFDLLNRDYGGNYQIDMFEYYRQKYRQDDINMVKRSLIYFDDVTESSWAAVKLLNGTLSADDVKRVITEEVIRCCPAPYKKKLKTSSRL